MASRALPCGLWGRVLAKNQASGYRGGPTDTPLGNPIRRLRLIVEALGRGFDSPRLHHL